MCGGCPPRELRAERDRLAQLRATCPPDRSRELRLATRRAAEAEQARQQARADHQAAAEQVAALAGRWRRRRELAAARERLVLAEHALRTTTGQADQAAERLGLLRRAQQRHLGWMEAHDAELRVQERAVAREAAWRRRVDQRALALDPPGWLLAELGPVPTDPQERAAWRVAAAELDGYRRAYGLDHPAPAKHGGGRVARDGRAAAPATRLAGEQAGGTAPAAGAPPPRRAHRIAAATAGSGRRWPTGGTGSTPSGCWAPNPAAQAPGRRRDWQAARAALERLADHHRHRDDRHRPPERDRPGCRLAATSAARNATAASWQKGAAHAPAPRPRRPTTRTWSDLEELGTPVYQGNGLSVRALTAEELQRFLDAHPGQPAQLLGSGWAALDPPGHPLGVPRTPPGLRLTPRRQPASRPSRSPAAWAAPAAPPWPQYRRRRARGAGRLDPQPGLAGAAGRRRRPRRRRARHPGRPARGRAGRPGGRRAGRLAAAVPPLRAGPAWRRGAARRAAHRPPAGPAHPRRLSWSSTTWPCPGRPRTSITW